MSMNKGEHALLSVIPFRRMEQSTGDHQLRAEAVLSPPFNKPFRRQYEDGKNSPGRWKGRELPSDGAVRVSNGFPSPSLHVVRQVCDVSRASV
jgi:hypothetical protein